MDNRDFLEPTFFIDCNEATIQEKSRELTAKIKGGLEKSQSIFYFVRDKIKYNLYSSRSEDSDFKASHILTKGQGYCVQKAVLLVALSRAVHIPARLRFAEIRIHETAKSLAEKRGSNVFPWHGLTDIYINDRWIKATPTYDLEYCKKAGITPVEFDGQIDALLPLSTLDGKPNVEYIEDYGFFHDLPLEQIRKASSSWKYIKS